MLTDYADTFLTEEDAGTVLGVPVLGFIPRIEDEGSRLISGSGRFSPLIESYRWLRTNLHFVGGLPDKPLRSLVITSAVPAEGKSTAAANLAIAMARDGKRVVLVDADLRRPVQQAIFKTDTVPGLVDFLEGTHTLEDVLRPTDDPNLRLIFGGTSSLNPTELLGTDALGRLLAELQSVCDIVLIDTSPMLVVADTMILASRADGVLVVIAHGETKRAHSLRAMEYLARARAKVVGTVFTRVSTSGGANFFFGRYYVPSVASAAKGPSESPEDKLLHRRY